MYALSNTERTIFTTIKYIRERKRHNGKRSFLAFKKDTDVEKDTNYQITLADNQRLCIKHDKTMASHRQTFATVVLTVKA